MKKKYDVLQDEITKEVGILGIIFLVGIMSGAIYAIRMRGNNVLFFTIHEYIVSGYDNVPKFQLIKSNVYQYTQICVLIWLLGLTRYTIPLMFVGFGVIGFSYGFTAACFGIIFGISGVGLALTSFGIQGLVLVGGNLYIGIKALEQRRKNLINFKQNARSLLNVLVIINSVCIIYMNIYLIMVN